MRLTVLEANPPMPLVTNHSCSATRAIRPKMSRPRVSALMCSDVRWRQLALVPAHAPLYIGDRRNRAHYNVENQRRRHELLSWKDLGCNGERDARMSRRRRQGQYLSLIHISEPTRLGMISYAVFCLKKKK